MEDENLVAKITAWQKRRDEPAFPLHPEATFGNFSGVSKRFFAACMAMQGILQSEYLMRAVGIATKDNQEIEYTLVRNAYRFADELLRLEEL